MANTLNPTEPLVALRLQQAPN
jgi:hypothetical protein